MRNQLIIRGCLERARFTLDLDLSIDLNEPLGIMGATGAGKQRCCESSPGWNLTSPAPWRSVERFGAMA